MTLDEAIEINTSLSKGTYVGLAADARAAEKLGAEALKMIKEGRLKPGGMFFHDLPGETEE